MYAAARARQGPSVSSHDASPAQLDPVDLRADTLPRLAGRLPVPTYDRGGLTTGIVHIGVGNFHRSHQAMYVDRLLAAGTARDWAIAGVGVLDSDVDTLASLTGQDCLVRARAPAPGRPLGRAGGRLDHPGRARPHRRRRPSSCSPRRRRGSCR